MRVDPTATTNPVSVEELRNWLAIDTTGRHRPVWLVVNPTARAPLGRGQAASLSCNGVVKPGFAAATGTP